MSPVAAGFLFHNNIADIFQSNKDAPIQCGQPALVVWNLPKGCVSHDLGGFRFHAQVRDQERVMEKIQQTYG